MFSAIEKWVSLITGKKTARGAKVAGQMALSSHITTTRSERKLFGWIDFLFLFYKSPHRSALNWFMIRKWNSDNSIRLPKKFFLRSISFQMSLQMFRNHNFSYFTIKSIYFGGYQRNNCYTKVFFWWTTHNHNRIKEMEKLCRLYFSISIDNHKGFQQSILQTESIANCDKTKREKKTLISSLNCVLQQMHCYVIEYKIG